MKKRAERLPAGEKNKALKAMSVIYQRCKKGITMTKKIKSDYHFLETLTPETKRKHEENYIDLVLSELLLAAMHEDDIR